MRAEQYNKVVQAEMQAVQAEVQVVQAEMQVVQAEMEVIGALEERGRAARDGVDSKR